MALTETQTWDAVIAQLAQGRGWGRRRKERLLRVIRGIQEHASTFELYPEVAGGNLDLFDEPVYDATFRMRLLSVRPRRWHRGFSVRHVYCGLNRHPGHCDEWNVPERALIPFLIERLTLLTWRRRK